MTTTTTTTTRQRAWLRHLANTGDTHKIPANTFAVLQREGLIERKLGSIYMLTAKGREEVA